MDVNDLFTENEWNFLYDTFNGIWITDDMRENVSVFQSSCESGITEDLCLKWDVDVSGFRKKTGSLTPEQVTSIYSKIEDYWSK